MITAVISVLVTLLETLLEVISVLSRINVALIAVSSALVNRRTVIVVSTTARAVLLSGPETLLKLGLVIQLLGYRFDNNDLPDRLSTVHFGFANSKTVAALGVVFLHISDALFQVFVVP